LRGVVHQDGNSELTATDHHHAQQEGERIGRPGEQRHAGRDQRPGVQDQQHADKV